MLCCSVLAVEVVVIVDVVVFVMTMTAGSAKYRIAEVEA
jgi:hypothetical protein